MEKIETMLAEFAKNWKDIFGIWGGIVATILLVLKVREEYRDRHRLDISYLLTGNPDGADVIAVANMSKRRVLIHYYELYYKTGHFL